MRPTQRALLRSTLDAALAACLRSPVATLDGAHLRAVLLAELLQGGCAVLEPTAEPRRGKLLRLVDDVVRVERLPLPTRPGVAGSRRAPRPPDLRVWAPERLDLEVHARGTLAAPPAGGGRALLERLGRLASRTTDALLLACDRRSYDALRRAAGVVRPGPPTDSVAAGREPSALGALCAAVLPPSCALTDELAEHEADVGRGQRYVAVGAVTPMVFGVQRVVVGLCLRGGAARSLDAAEPVAQLDAFAAD